MWKLYYLFLKLFFAFFWCKPFFQSAVFEQGTNNFEIEIWDWAIVLASHIDLETRHGEFSHQISFC